MVQVGRHRDPFHTLTLGGLFGWHSRLLGSVQRMGDVPVNDEPSLIDLSPQPRHATLALSSRSGTCDHRLPAERGADKRVLGPEHRDLNIGVRDLERPHGWKRTTYTPPANKA